MKIGAVFAVAAVLGLPGCASMRAQDRADELQQSIDGLAKGGHRKKDDFIRLFGIPTACAPLATGEFCQWDTERGYQGAGFVGRNGFAVSSQRRVSDEIRIEFDKSGNFVSGNAVVQRGDQTYQGGNETDHPSRPDPTFGDCPQGQTLQNGSCLALNPVQR